MHALGATLTERPRLWSDLLGGEAARVTCVNCSINHNFEVTRWLSRNALTLVPPRPSRNLVWRPFATKEPVWTLLNSTSSAAVDLPTFRTRASMTTLSPSLAAVMYDTFRSSVTPLLSLTDTRAAVERTSTSVAMQPPCNVLYLFSTWGVTGRTQVMRPGSTVTSLLAGLRVRPVHLRPAAWRRTHMPPRTPHTAHTHRRSRRAHSSKRPFARLCWTKSEASCRRSVPAAGASAMHQAGLKLSWRTSDALTATLRRPSALQTSATSANCTKVRLSATAQSQLCQQGTPSDNRQ